MCADIARGILDFGVVYTPHPQPDLHFATLGEVNYRLISATRIHRNDIRPESYIRAAYSPAFDAAHAAAMKVSTANPVRWSAALFNANVEKSRGGVGAPPVENLTAELEALVKDDDASADDKAAAEKALKTIKTMAELKSKPLNLKFTAVDGREVDLEKMRGKVVLIDFWATWCGPCVAELPNVLNAYKELHPKGFEIVGISLDSDKVQLEKFVKDQGMAWPQFFDGKGWKNEISSSYSINSIPTMWLVDQKGMVIDTAARSGLEEKVVKLLK
jgi:thiol-disulfide isomerase/thioredoxin